MSGDRQLGALGIGAFMLVIFHPIAEIMAISESHDRIRLWALIPGPGPMIAAATLNPKAVPEPAGSNLRAAYGVLGVTEIAAVGLLASAPLWKHPARASLPDVNVGAGSASLTWKF